MASSSAPPGGSEADRRAVRKEVQRIERRIEKLDSREKQLHTALAEAATEPGRLMALDAELRAAGTNLHHHFGAVSDSVASGVSVGIFDDLDALLAAVQGYVDDGYARIKIKIEPGWDIEPTRLVRELIGPEMGLQVDANTAYTRADAEHLARLDDGEA